MSILKLALAVNRQRFKDLIEEYLSGGMREYVKAEVAAANGYLDYLDHWHKEVNNLIEESLFEIIRHKKIVGFSDRAKAIQEVISEYNSIEEYRREVLAAKFTLARKYFKNSKRYTDSKDPDIQTGWNAFWIQVTSMVNDALEQCGEPV